ncbi:GNAT family N-acetyltransferase [Phenylobacterium sp.]|uniref:GNAT family N-acetyltransferase n=1 Tax=Phenylobacterium sp. TaxID=1871053 RepID=UPI00301E4248
MDDAGLRADPPRGLVIRRARPDELGACANVYVRVLTDTFTWLPPERHRAEDFLAAARDEEVFVAVDAGRIVGVAALYRPQAFLHSLYVGDRGRGVGRLLLRYVLAAAGGRLELKCQTANRRAQAFYLREGFRCVEAGEDGGVPWLRFVHG